MEDVHASKNRWCHLLFILLGGVSFTKLEAEIDAQCLHLPAEQRPLAERLSLPLWDCRQVISSTLIDFVCKPRRLLEICEVSLNFNL